jgi:hypothetical protein
VQNRLIPEHVLADSAEPDVTLGAETLAVLLRRARESEWYARRCAEDEKLQRKSTEAAMAVIAAEKVPCTRSCLFACMLTYVVCVVCACICDMLHTIASTYALNSYTTHT